MTGPPLSRRRLGLLVFLLGTLAAPGLGAAQTRNPDQVVREITGLGWQHGPTESRIGSVATIKVPEKQLFLDAPNTRRFLELNGNPPRVTVNRPVAIADCPGSGSAATGSGALILMRFWNGILPVTYA